MNIHMIGIAGVGMGNLAVLLKKLNHRVTGSDSNVFPPMSDYLEKEHIQFSEGFCKENIPQETELVIVGNAIRKDNIEVVQAEKMQCNCISMPQAIQNFLLKNKKSIVVSGTHGKTTTTALLAHVLSELGENPGFFVGGIANNLGTGGAVGSGELFVIEGDEYDSAFFRKQPKFLDYSPQYLLLTALEFDHGDIYKDLQAIEAEFVKLVQLVPSEGFIIAHSIYPSLKLVVKQAHAPVHLLGENDDDDFQITSWNQLNGRSCSFELFARKFDHRLKFYIPMAGQHNVWNAANVATLCLLLGQNEGEIQAAFNKFEGVQRRQQILFKNDTLVLLEDFAHHPTAVRLTIESVRKWFPDHKIYALFEPRSNTSRRNYHQATLPKALAEADQSILFRVYKEDLIEKNEVLDRNKVKQDIESLGKVCHLPNSVDELLDLVTEFKGKRVILMMSNGNIDGFKANYLARLKQST